MAALEPPRVFISYSHDNPAHQDRVLDFADRLRADGIDASIDQYVPFPGEGWPGWCETEIRKAQFVLLVCTAMNAAPCFFRACFMSCSRAIGAFLGAGPHLTQLSRFRGPPQISYGKG